MEVEIKVKIESIEDMEKTILSKGAIFQREVYEEDLYFNHPCRNFASTDEALRIRNDGTLTYKGPKIDRDTKSREEINLQIGSIEKANKMLNALGFKFVAAVRKRRRYYKLGDLNITLDLVEGLGEFMEIECIGKYGPCREKVLSLASHLGLKNFITESYLELILNAKE